jgi:hypothetical protein
MVELEGMQYALGWFYHDPVRPFFLLFPFVFHLLPVIPATLAPFRLTISVLSLFLPIYMRTAEDIFSAFCVSCDPFPTHSIITLYQRVKKIGVFCIQADRCPSRGNN